MLHRTHQTIADLARTRQTLQALEIEAIIENRPDWATGYRRLAEQCARLLDPNPGDEGKPGIDDVTDEPDDPPPLATRKGA